MLHLPSLIQDLGIILAAAAVVSLIFKQLKQPVVLGYIIAGIFVSPHVPLLPTVQDHESIKIWAEIGVIFLLFGLGLEFSFKKLAQVGKPASVTAISEVLVMLGIGYGLGQILSWSKMDSLFLGGILSISSTTIIVRAFDELGMKGRSFVSLVFGVLIIEDLVAILLLVLLSTGVATEALSGSELISSTLKLGFFLVLWFVVGIYILPSALRVAKKLLTDETTLVIAIGLCFLMVIFATHVGFSPALGAFVMGSIMAETREGKRVEHLIEPVKKLFAAVFFVSVGMMIDPQILYQHFWVILLISFVTIIGKLFGSGFGALLSGQSLKHSVQSGLSLAQIGEFSFIIATLGLTMKVTSDFLYPIAVAVSAITTFTTPYLIKNSEKIYEFLEKHLPEKFIVGLQHYQRRVSKTSGRGIFKTLWETYGIKLVLNLVVVIAIVLSVRRLLYPIIAAHFEDSVALRLLTGVLSIVLASPFLVGMFSGGKFRSEPKNKLGRVYRKIERRFLFNLEDQKQTEGPAKVIPELAPWDATLVQFKLSAHSPFVAKTLSECMIREQFGVTVALIERGNKKIITPGRNDLLLPHDILYLIGTDDQLSRIQEVIQPTETEESGEALESIGLESMRLHQGSEYIGKSIRNCGLREVINGLIVGIEREGKRILNPDSTEILKFGDLLWVVGDRKKIRAMTSGSGSQA
jgi:CPA2 family monovalent cation:H+ antiporter-2